jgi:hypothetical protein
MVILKIYLPSDLNEDALNNRIDSEHVHYPLFRFRKYQDEMGRFFRRGNPAYRHIRE